MKTLIAGIVGATLAFSGAAYAQDKYPSKPIRMIVGYAPGGGSDNMGRLIAPQITMRALRLMRVSTVSRMSPPTLSKYTSTPFGQCCFRPSRTLPFL